jgi:hypothetical protein
MTFPATPTPAETRSSTQFTAEASGPELISPDGTWRWDGTAWVPRWQTTPPPPLHPAPQADPVQPAKQQPGSRTPSTGHRWLIGGGIAAAVLVAGGAVVLATGAGGSSGSSSVPTHHLVGTLQVNSNGIGSGSDSVDDGCGMAGAATTEVLDRLNGLLDNKTYACGDGPGGGYTDIKDGTTVSVTDSTGKLIGTGALSGGTLAAGVVRFKFVANVPDTDFYKVEVANRGAIPFSKADLTTKDWSVGLTLG